MRFAPRVDCCPNSGLASRPGQAHPVTHREKVLFRQRRAGDAEIASVPNRDGAGGCHALDVGKDGLAVRTADVVVAASQTLGEAKACYDEVKQRLAKFGRRPDDPKILAGISPIVGFTDAEAKAKYSQLQELIPDAVGPASLASYLRPIYTFTLPGLLFSSAASRFNRQE